MKGNGKMFCRKSATYFDYSTTSSKCMQSRCAIDLYRGKRSTCSEERIDAICSGETLNNFFEYSQIWACVRTLVTTRTRIVAGGVVEWISGALDRDPEHIPLQPTRLSNIRMICTAYTFCKNLRVFPYAEV